MPWIDESPLSSRTTLSASSCVVSLPSSTLTDLIPHFSHASTLCFTYTWLSVLSPMISTASPGSTPCSLLSCSTWSFTSSCTSCEILLPSMTLLLPPCDMLDVAPPPLTTCRCSLAPPLGALLLHRHDSWQRPSALTQLRDFKAAPQSRTNPHESLLSKFVVAVVESWRGSRGATGASSLRAPMMMKQRHVRRKNKFMCGCCTLVLRADNEEEEEEQEQEQEQEAEEEEEEEEATCSSFRPLGLLLLSSPLFLLSSFPQQELEGSNQVALEHGDRDLVLGRR
mmetsp:Transcript_49159/g.154331  ORF Transcript_49159/g.154331 Transcript_49159/m.154331 type:complete len:282 (+) Transcript_49159:790-1635(+)